MKNSFFYLSRAFHVFFGFNDSCRFTPTCSQYASEAIEKNGLFTGGLLGVWRILRCHPWGSYGNDPVPKLKRVWKKV